MQQILLKLLGALIVVNTLFTACITSKVRPIAQVENNSQTDSSSIKVFLLERDIPKEIEQLGVVSISVNSRPTLSLDEEIKQQLRKDCQ